MTERELGAVECEMNDTREGDTPEVAVDTSLSLDDLFHEERTAEIEAHEKAAKEQMIPPKGTWLSDPGENALTLTLSRMDDGRRVISVAGVMTHKKTDARAFIRVRMSPDPVMGEDGKYDFKYRVYVTAVDAYKDVFGDAAPSPGHVAEYLQKYPAGYSGFQGDRDLVVSKVFAVRG